MLFTIEEYKEALLFDDSFKTLKIKPVTDSQGEFIFSSGRTAVVFKVEELNTGKYKALKCFTQIHKDAIQRSHMVSNYLQFVHSPYLVRYEFLNDEIWVNNSYQSVVLMDWIEGDTLIKVLKALCKKNDIANILRIALAFDQMALCLLAQNYAHGDLKADNLILNPQKHLVMVDYDGFFLPTMQGLQAKELGTEDYQHPERKTDFFNKDIDDVSILIISTALHALVKRPELFNKYNHGENLLFTKNDLHNTFKSELWNELMSIESNMLRNRLNLLNYAIQSPPKNQIEIKEVLQITPLDISSLEIIKNISAKNKAGKLEFIFKGFSGDIIGMDGNVNKIILLTSEKILVGGSFSNGICCFNLEGQFNLDFLNSSHFFLNGEVNDIQLLKDNKILIGGYFDKNITQLFINGMLDPNFKTGIGLNKGVYTINIQPDGKILVGGWFNSFNGAPCNSFIRLLQDGTLDENFQTGSGFNSWVYCTYLQKDGKILVGGNFSLYNKKSSNRIIRLTSNGGLDESFKTGSGFDEKVFTIHIQSDGKILAGGAFTSYNGITCKHIVRLNPDGSIDENFKIGSGFDESVFTITMQPDGKILAGGAFTSYNGKICNRIVRLNIDGDLDNEFQTGSGFDRSVNALLVLPDNKLLVGGNFTSYNLEICNHIVCLHL